MTRHDRCVVTASDADYFPALIALLRSLRRTNPHLDVVVFDGGLTKRQSARVRAFADVIPKKPSVELEGRGKFSYIGNTTLLKLEVTDLDYDKVLYLDADTVVLDAIDELFSFPKGTVGVVNERTALKNIFRVQHREMLKEVIDADWERPAFNAGLFALRPAEWRYLPDMARELIEKFGADVFSKTKDQQLLNLIFRAKTCSFPGRYNFSPFYDDAGECAPAVIHYLTQCKPWHSGYPRGYFYDRFRSNITAADFPEIVLVDIRRAFEKIKLSGRR